MARKLTTIMAADAVGYSALMERDERGALEALQAAHAVFVDQVVTKSGRLFGSAGDSFVAEFASPVEAVEAARDIQRELCGQGSRSDAPSLSFRIGINIGDVLVEDDNLLGDGVNVASRLESIAGPGEIFLSRSVYEQVRGKTDAQMIALGSKRLKNLDRRVDVFAIRAPEGLRPPAPVRAAPARRWYYAGIALAMALGLVATMSQRDRAPSNRLSLAVMPLGVLGGDDATRRLAQGLTDDIITDLSRFKTLDIVASNSVAAVQQTTADDAAVGRRLNVRYVLDGTVQRENEQLRVSAALLDMQTGATVWSQRWDSTAEDAFAIQTEVAEKIAAALASAESSAAITASEISRLKASPPDTLQAYDLYLLAVAENGSFTREDIAQGIDHATRAIAEDPEFARAYAIRARLLYNSTHYGADYGETMRKVKVDAERSVALDPNGAESRAALAWYFLTTGRVGEADVQITTALSQNPANVTLMKMAAAIYAASGRPDEAVSYADKVLELDPLATAGTLNTIKDAYFFAGQYENAVTVISRVPEASRSRGSRLLLTLSLRMLGREEAFAEARRTLLAAHPNVSAELLLNEGWVFERQEDQDLFLKGFEMSGLPRCASPEEIARIDNPRRLAGCGG